MLPFRFGRRFPAGGRPARRGDSIGKGRQQHDDEVDDAEDEKRLRNAGIAAADDVHAFRAGDDHVAHVRRTGDHHFRRRAGDVGIASTRFGDQGHDIDAAEVLRRLVEEPQEILFHWRANHRAAAEAHDGHAGRHATPVREPADQGTDGRDVAQPQAAAADDAVAEIQEPELVREDADAADEKAAAPADGRDDTDPARAHLLEPTARHRGG